MFTFDLLKKMHVAEIEPLVTASVSYFRRIASQTGFATVPAPR